MTLALRKLETLPAERPIVADFESKALVLRRQTVDVQRDLTTKQRAIKNERLLFCRQVKRTIDERGVTTAEAVAIVATRTEQFSMLVHGGKGGKSALTIHNYRKWMSKLGKHANGRPKWDNDQALADRYCTTVRERRGDLRFWQIFASYYEHENQRSVAESHRLAVLTARRAGILDVDMPSKDQVGYWYNTHADPAAVYLARYGEEATTNAIIGYLRRDWSSVEVGELWIGDHHQFDAPCRVPGDEENTWKAVRPWLTAWMDAKSWRFVGWLIRADESPDSLAIEDALLMGIRQNGNRPPRWLQTDNGKDFKSTGFATAFSPDHEYEHSICLELDLQITRALPYNARSKLVERQFLSVCQQFSKWWAGYLGSNPQARPKAAQKHWENPESLPTLQQFCEAFAHWLQEHYHSQPGHGKILAGKSPQELWDARPDLREPLADETLFFAFLKPYRRTPTVGRGAVIRVMGREYRSNALWPWFGKKVMVKLDRFNLAHVFAYQFDGRLIAECEEIRTVPALARTEAERKLIGTEMARVRRQLTRARTIARDAKGDIKVLSPVDRLQIVQPDATPTLPPTDPDLPHQNLPKGSVLTESDRRFFAEVDNMLLDGRPSATDDADDLDDDTWNEIMEVSGDDDETTQDTNGEAASWAT